MREGDYQTELIRELRYRFPGCFILKNDSSYLQGVPDLLILVRDKWAMLEVKSHENAHEQPNQQYYVTQLNQMSFAAFIFPENEELVLQQLEILFAPPREIRRRNKRSATKEV
jgi:hypothetical protein